VLSIKTLTTLLWKLTNSQSFDSCLFVGLWCLRYLFL
jgi:hypothetical protein